MAAVLTRPLDPKRDHRDLVGLFDAVFGGTVTPEMWAWKYMPPWTKRHYCWVAETKGKVVGYCGAVPLLGQLGGKPLPYFQLADMMVHPDHRRTHDWFDLGPKQILADLGKSHRQHVLYGFSGHRAFLWFKRTGLVDLVENAVTGIVRRPAQAVQGDHAVLPRSWDDPVVDAAWQTLASDHRTGLIRDAQYVGWRYRDHPLNGYQLYGVQCRGRDVGWLVIGTDPPGEHGRAPEIPVVDLMLPRESVRPALVELATLLGRDVMCWQPQHRAPAWDTTSDPGTHVFHFVRQSAAPTEMLREQLYYTMGDVDWW